MSKTIRLRKEPPKRRNLVVEGMILAGKSQKGMRDRRERRPNDARRSWKNEDWE